MRFAFLICAVTVLSTPVFTPQACAQIYARADAKAPSALRDPSDIRRRAVGSSETPFVAAGLYAERVGNSLGYISAMVSLEDGSIYALGKDSGQLFHLTDRGLDGRIDTQRPLVGGFETPSGLAFSQGALFVSDMKAVWRVDLSTGEKSHFVSLKNITAGEDRPLLAYENRLLMGLSKTPHSASVLSIDMTTGQATHLTDIPEGPIRGLSYGGGQLWAAVGGSLRPVEAQSNSEFAKTYPLEAGTAAMAVMLPSKDTVWPTDWPAAMREYILVIQGPAPGTANDKRSGGNNIAALPSQFGAPSENLSILTGGFMGQDGQTAWAQPSALLMDSRGLFFADRLGGSLWRVSVDNRPPRTPRVKISKPLPPLPTQKPSLKPNETPPLTGSMIGEASGLGEASTLKVGSFLKKEHDEKEAAKLAEEKAKEDAETKAKTQAREARRLRLQPGSPEQP